MEKVTITAAAVAHPNRLLDQRQAAESIRVATGDRRRVRALALGTRIERRAIALDVAEIQALANGEERNRAYARLAPALAIAAARNLGCSLRPAEIDFLVSASCTGYMVPSWDTLIAPELGLRGDVARLPITEAGCAGGAVALARGVDYLRARPGERTLVIAAEVCSVCFHACAEQGNLTAALIFGDGAGAAVLEAGSGARGLEVLDCVTFLVANTRHVLGFNLTETGFYPVLTKELVDLLPKATEQALCRLLARSRLSISDIRFWLLHPGGARILSRLEDTFDLGQDQTCWSWASLRDFGNTSSAAIFDVLRRYLADPNAPDGIGVVAAFGPGLSIELLLVRRC